MGDWTSTSDSEDTLEWDSDSDSHNPGSLHVIGSSTGALRKFNAPGPSTLDPKGVAGPFAYLVEHFLTMGFTLDMILKAAKDNGNDDEESLLDLLLTYKMQAITNNPSAENCSTPSHVPDAIDKDADDILENWDDENIGLLARDVKDKKVKSLMGMGFAEAIAQMAVTKCGFMMKSWNEDDSFNFGVLESRNSARSGGLAKKRRAEYLAV